MSLFDDWKPEDAVSTNPLFQGWGGGEVVAAPAPAMTPLEGMAASTVSAIPELFGFSPMEGVKEWRAEHPVLDLATTFAGMAVPYGGMYAASTRIPRAARALEGATEGTLKAFGTTAARSPVSSGALKEFYRYTPLELSRLGTGLTVGDEDMGAMFADVALSQALAAGLGGVGGFLRAGGKKLAGEVSVAEADFGMLPTFELRMAKLPESNLMRDGRVLDDAAAREQFIYSKTQEALQYVPEGGKGSGLKGRYLYDVENMAPSDVNWMESHLFKTNPSRAGHDTLQNRAFDVRQLHTDGKSWSVGSGVGEDVAKRAGFEDLGDLAQSMVYPRRVVPQVSSDGRTNGASQMGAWLRRGMDSGAIEKVAGDTWVMREDGGLLTVMKRLQRGTVPPKPPKGRRPGYQFGPAQVRPGDEWLIGKMDNLEKVVPEGHQLAKITTQQWAKWKDPLRQLTTNNPFGQRMNQMVSLLDPSDWQAARTLRRSGWVSQTSAKVADKLKAETGLADMETVHKITSSMYDAIAPKAFKVQSDPVYGRYYGLMENVMQYAQGVARSFVYGSPTATGSLSRALRGAKGGVEYRPFEGFEPVTETLRRLDEAELQQLAQIGIAKMPASELKAMKEAGELAPKVEDAANKLQALNRHVLDKYVLPALEEAGRAGDMAWLDGYFMPRLYKGDHMLRVVDEKGRPQWVAAGATPKEAQQMADAVVAEAKLEGKNWSYGKVESMAFKEATDAESLEKVYASVREQMGQSADAQATVSKAMRKLMSERQAQPNVPTPSRLRNQRTGIMGSPDTQKHTMEDMVKAIEGHYNQLLKYSAAHSWDFRFGDQAKRWGATQAGEKAYADLMRKKLQWLGVEGQLTNTMNKLLQPVLGDMLGGKAATRIAAATNGLMYAWNLGIMNPTFALLNLLTPLQTTAPWIAFMQRAPTEEIARMSQQTLTFNSAGQVTGSTSVLSPLKVMWEAAKLMRNPTKELSEFYTQGRVDGTLAPQLFDEALGVDTVWSRGLRDAWGKNGWEFIKESATLLSTRSEQYSRLVSFNSAYLLGKNHFGLEGDALYNFIRKGTETTMYGYSVMDRGRLLTGPVGSTWGLFKNWQFHFIGQMVQYGGLALKDGIWAPMLWQGAAATAIGGLGATPLVVLANGLAKFSSDQPDAFSYMQNNWGPEVGDGLFFGLPGLLGVSLQASAAVPGTDAMQDIESMMNVVAWERGKAAFGAIGSAADLFWESGENPLRNGNVRDKLMAAFLPRAGFRALSAVEGDYIKSMSTGQPSVRDLPLGARVLHGAGFNMAEVEKHYIIGERLWEVQERKRATVQALGEQFAQARMVGDDQAMTLIAQRAITSGVDINSVLSSAETRWRREMFGDYLSRFDKRDQAEARQLLERGGR